MFTQERLNSFNLALTFINLNMSKSVLSLLAASFFAGTSLYGQQTGVNTAANPVLASREVQTYVNPILPGDHPDPTLLKAGEDYYMCGSSFHFTPWLPILHSRDLLHWETVSRVVPADWAEMRNGGPGQGIWQGAITYFYGSFYIYYSNTAGGGQYFSKADNPKGPWSAPVKVKETPDTRGTGYDNSIFVDDDGTPYMIIKTGQFTNRLQQIGRDGHLTGKLMNMDWMNSNKRFSWAEGPVMCKKDGWYYYFPAGDVSGGQFVLRSKELSTDSAKWENLGNVFAFSGVPSNRFRSSNHMSAPFQLADGTWWCIAQSYDAPQGDDWSGQGRQDLLFRVHWDAAGKPYVPNPSDQPLQRPNIKTQGLAWCLPRSDYFDKPTVGVAWHFLNKTAAAGSSASARTGWLRIDPGTGKGHILQKEGGRFYTAVTKVDVDAVADGQQAGIYLASGNQGINVRLAVAFAGSKKIIFELGTQHFEAANTQGNVVWLKLDRSEHELTGYYSADGSTWTKVGTIDSRSLDKSQPGYNSWVGTSMGLFATGKPADFDLFLYRDGFSTLPAKGYNNYYGVVTASDGSVTTTTDNGGWFMLGGVDLGGVQGKATKVELEGVANASGTAEIWIDDIGHEGKKIATISLKKGAAALSAKVAGLTGQHDVYVRITGSKEVVAIKNVRFIKG